MLRKNNNILLKKDDVGVSKPTTRDLPEFGHAYGLPGARDNEGVGRRKCIEKLKFNLFVFQYSSNYCMDSSRCLQRTKAREGLPTDQ